MVGGLLVVLIALLVVFGLQIYSVSGRLEARNESLMSAVRDNTASLDFLKQNLMLLAEDSNDARQALKLPGREYPILKQSAEAASKAPPTDSQEMFLDGLDTLIQDRDQQITRRRFAELASSPELARMEQGNGLKPLKSGSDSLILDRNGRSYFTITIDPVSRNVRIVDFLGRELTVHGVEKRMGDFLKSRTAALDTHFTRLSSDLSSFAAVLENPAVREIVKKNGLTITKPQRNEIGYSMSVERGGAILLNVTLNSRTLGVSSGAHRYGNVDSFLAGFPDDLRNLDLTTLAQRRVDAARKRIESLRDDKTFMLALSSRRIKLTTSPRQDIDYYYYDFTDADGNRIGSFAVQKKLGTIYLMDSQGVPISALKTLQIDTSVGSKKKLPNRNGVLSSSSKVTAGNPGSSTEAVDFLLCGAHQDETDTIIVVHADRAQGRIVLISIPRDLYYKGRKINAVYEHFGPQELTREIAEITGLPIRKYIVIDMYAFIDVINIVGGIDVYLPEPLVDPTYRVRNNGQWTTLSYTAGMHHLDGIATLRIARSRHTSSDFARAYRQQDILAAIRKKIERMDVFDVSKLYNLVGVFFRYIDTNFTPAELVNLFLTYRNVPTTGHFVIDTANVLYQTYTNIYYLGNSGKHLSNDFNKGAWIVLPKNDDWNVIRLYVSKILGGDTP